MISLRSDGGRKTAINASARRRFIFGKQTANRPLPLHITYGSFFFTCCATHPVVVPFYKQTQEQEKQQPLYLSNTKSSSSSNLIPVPTQNLGPKSGGLEKKLGDTVIKGVS